MLTQLRNSAKSWITKLLLGLIMVTFVISFGVGSINNPKEVLVEVDSHEILVSQFQREYRDAENRLGRLYRINADQIPALARQLNLRRQVIEFKISDQFRLECGPMLTDTMGALGRLGIRMAL